MDLKSAEGAAPRQEDPAESGQPPVPKINPVTGKPTLPRAPKACARCRRQKLRCDPYRPCALCVRACVECVNQNPDEVAETRRANKAKREQKKNREKQAVKATEEQHEHHHESPGSYDSQSPEASDRPVLSFDDGNNEPPRKRPKYIKALTGDAFPMPSFSSEDAERYIQRRQGSDMNSATFSFDDREVSFNPTVVPSMGEHGNSGASTPERGIRRHMSDVAAGSKRSNTAEMRVYKEPGMEKEGSGSMGASRAAGGEAKSSPSDRTNRNNPQRQLAMAQLMQLPPKALAEFLIETYLFSVQGFLVCAHEPTFKRRYEELVRCREEAIKEGSAGHVKPITLPNRVENHILHNLVRLMDRKMERDFLSSGGGGGAGEEHSNDIQQNNNIPLEASRNESLRPDTGSTNSHNVDPRPFMNPLMSKKRNQLFFESLLSALDVVKDQGADQTAGEREKAPQNPQYELLAQQEQQQQSPPITAQPSPVSFQAQASLNEPNPWPAISVPPGVWGANEVQANPYMQPYAYGLDWVARGGGDSIAFTYDTGNSGLPTGEDETDGNLGGSQGVRYM